MVVIDFEAFERSGQSCIDFGEGSVEHLLNVDEVFDEVAGFIVDEGVEGDFVIVGAMREGRRPLFKNVTVRGQVTEDPDGLVSAGFLRRAELLLPDIIDASVSFGKRNAGRGIRIVEGQEIGEDAVGVLWGSGEGVEDVR